MPTITDLYNKELRKLMTARDQIGTELNNTERHLSAQLILLNTVLISATVILIGAVDGKSIKLSLPVSILVLVSFILLIISVLGGISYYFAAMKHYKRWIDVKDEIIKKISQARYTSLEELGEDMIDKQTQIPAEANKFFLYLQIISLVAAFLIYIALIAIFAFSAD